MKRTVQSLRKLTILAQYLGASFVRVASTRRQLDSLLTFARISILGTSWTLQNLGNLKVDVWNIIYEVDLENNPKICRLTGRIGI